MLIFLTIFLSGLLLFIAYHDFRYHMLPASVLILAFLVVILRSIILNGWYVSLLYGGINLIIIVVQFLLLTIYFSAKNKQWMSIVNTYIGFGDLLFYGSLAFCFSPFNFVFFNAAACFIIIFVYLFKYNKSVIPLAGCLSLLLLALLSLTYFINILLLYEDTILLSGLSLIYSI